MASIAKRGKKHTVIVYVDGNQKWTPGMIPAKAKLLKRFFDGIDDIDQDLYQIALDTILGINDQIMIEKNMKIEEFRDKVKEKLLIKEEELNGCVTVREFFWEFAEKYGKIKWGANYHKKAVSNMEHYVFPYLGDCAMSGITVKMIDDHYTFLITEAKPAMCKYRKPLEKVTASLVNDVHKILRCMFNIAVKWETVSSNPFLKATLPEYESKERESLSTKALQTLLQHLDDESDYDKFVLYCAILLDFSCTTRSGEISAFKWSDYCAEKKEIHIWKELARFDKNLMDRPKVVIYEKFPALYPGCKSQLVLTSTKTEDERTSYLPALVVEKLNALKRMQAKNKQLIGDEYVDYDLIICQSNGRLISSEYLNNGFKRYCAELGYPDVVFHSIRSTSATFKLKISGGDVKAVQGEGGWRDPKMVTKQYSRIREEDRRGLSDIMDKDEFFGGAVNKESQERAAQMQTLLALAENDPEQLKALFDSLNLLAING